MMKEIKEMLIKKNLAIRTLLILILVALLGSIFSVGAISASNYFICESAIKNYKIDHEGKKADGAKTGKFSEMLTKCQRQHKIAEKTNALLFSTWFLGLPISFIGFLLFIWAYVIKKHGILVGGSLGIIPPIIIASVLSPLWPAIFLIFILISVFKFEYIEAIKDTYLIPFRRYSLKGT